MSNENYEYVGSELEIFREAQNWKSYYEGTLRSYLGKEVLEVGAGLGSTSTVLCNANVQRWVCLEPDKKLHRQLEESLAVGRLPGCCTLRLGTVADLPSSEHFETIVYIDVLEHIEDDRNEIQRAAKHLNAGGHLVVLAPAHNWLFSRFDKAVGHYRRYTCRSLLSLTAEGLRPVAGYYLDSVGMLASLANRFMLRANLPSRRQVIVWDRWMVPASKILDPLFLHRLGKTVIVVWRRES